MKKREMIDELMEGTEFSCPQDIRKRLERKDKSVIGFYFYGQYKAKGMPRAEVIDNIMRIG